MGKQPCCDKIGLKRGPWTIEEDQKLINFILNNGIHCWRLVPQLAGLMRCGKSCRLRWTNYLRPDLKRGALSQAEEDLIIQLHSHLGNRWSKIASHFPGRTDNEIKNHWNTRIKKRLKLLGMDPVTHKPIEQPGKCGLKEEQVSQLNSSQVEDKSVEATSMVDSIKENISTIGKTEDGVGLGSESSNIGLLHGNAMPWESLDMQEMTAQVNPSTSCSTSFSMEDSCFPSFVGGEPTNYEGSNPGQSDAIDSFSSWDGLYHFEDMFSFGSYPRA